MVHFKIVGDKSSQTKRGYGYEEELSSVMEEVTLLRGLVNSDNVGTFALKKDDAHVKFYTGLFLSSTLFRTLFISSPLDSTRLVDT